jgi:hypothetical protein
MSDRQRRINDGFRWADQREVITGFMNMCFGFVGLASGLATGGAVSCSYAFLYMISGVMYSRAANADGVASVAGGTASLAAQNQLTVCKYAIAINNGGSLFMIKGNEATAEASAFLPAVPSSLCFIGYLSASMLSNKSWSAGVSAITASLHVFTNCALVPQGAIISD